MLRPLKELRAAIYTFYKTVKESKPEDPFLIFRDHFADELFNEAMAELKSKESEAAKGTLLLSGTQATTLRMRGKLMDRINLKFRESPEQMLESMAGFEAFDAEIKTVQGKKMVALHRSNGIAESTVFAEFPEITLNENLFVLEPFTLEGGERIWTEMSVKEREELKPGTIRNASAMPKRMMSRRVEVTDLVLRFDNRTAWIEAHYKEIEAYSRSTEEVDALIAEFNPSTEAKNEEVASSDADSAPGVSSQELDEAIAGGVNVSGVEDEELHEELQQHSQTAPEILAKLEEEASKSTIDSDDELELPE